MAPIFLYSSICSSESGLFVQWKLIPVSIKQSLATKLVT